MCSEKFAGIKRSEAYPKHTSTRMSAIAEIKNKMIRILITSPKVESMDSSETTNTAPIENSKVPCPDRVDF
jgi:hypothetical protein